MTFMDLENPDYAYMFGFLQMDGHLAAGTGKRGRLMVEIAHRDVAVLQRFRELSPYPSSIRERTRATNFAESYRSATWTLCALEARERLVELGLPYGKKSQKVKPPRVPFSRRDYVRGVIDADGSVGTTGQGLPFVGLTTASTAIATYLCFYVRQTIGAERRAGRNARDGVYNVLYTKEAAVDLARHLYYPGALALQRKQEAARVAMQWTRPADMARRPSRKRWQPHEDRILLEIGDAAAAAPVLDRTPASCGMRLWRLRAGRTASPPPGISLSP